MPLRDYLSIGLVLAVFLGLWHYKHTLEENATLNQNLSMAVTQANDWKQRADRADELLGKKIEGDEADRIELARLTGKLRELKRDDPKYSAWGSSPLPDGALGVLRESSGEGVGSPAPGDPNGADAVPSQ